MTAGSTSAPCRAPGLGSFYAGGDRGVLYALDARSGEVEWWFDTTNGGFNAMAVAGGGGLWYPPSIDADGNIYFGVGNPAPWPMTPECPNGDVPAGRQPVHLDDGVHRPGHGRHPVVLPGRAARPARPGLPVDAHPGRPSPSTAPTRALAIGSGKTGNVVAVRQDTGEVVWKTPVGMHQNDTPGQPLPEDGSTVEVYPGSLGGVETPIAYADGVLFVPYLDYPAVPDHDGRGRRGRAWATTRAEGGLAAIDATNGSILWDIKFDTLPVAAATVANDVVFAGGIDGIFAAYSTAATGEELWRYEADSGFNAPPAIAGDYLFVGARASPSWRSAMHRQERTPEASAGPRRDRSHRHPWASCSRSASADRRRSRPTRRRQSRPTRADGRGDGRADR